MFKRELQLLVTLCVAASLGFAQEGRRGAAALASRAAGGRVTIGGGEPTDPVPSLDMLIHRSVLIVDGTAADVLPAVAADPNPDVPSAETYSVVTVTEVLSAVAVTKPSSLYVVQMGGKAGKWEVYTPDVPLLQKGERCILFLDPDVRAEGSYDPGTPRYNAVGIWSGFVKIKNGKIGFLPNAVPALHDYDNMDADAFLAQVGRRVDAIVPKDQIILPHAVHVPRFWIPLG